MPEIKLTLTDPHATLCVLGEAAIEFDNENAPHSKALVDALRDQIRAQLPQAPVEEPTEWGSVVRARRSPGVPLTLLAYVPEPDEIRDSPYSWYSDQDSWHIWSDLSDVEVLRVGVGGLPPMTGADLSRISVETHRAKRQAEIDKGAAAFKYPLDSSTVITINTLATPPAEAVEADGAVVVAGRIDAITRDAIDEALYDPSRAGNCAAKAHKAVLALLADSPLGATSTVSAEPTPEQVEADLAQDEQAHARCYAQAASAPAEGDAIEALVQEFISDETWPPSLQGVKWLYVPDGRLRAFAARVLEVGGQQSGVPACQSAIGWGECVLADGHQEHEFGEVGASSQTNHVDRWGRQWGVSSSGALPEEPTS